MYQLINVPIYQCANVPMTPPLRTLRLCCEKINRKDAEHAKKISQLINVQMYQ